MKILRITTLLIVLIAAACCSSNKTTGSNNAESQLVAEKMMEEGYKKGIVQASTEENDCAWTIQIIDNDDFSYFLDPINLDENFKQNNEKIWFKFQGLKMPNRCDKANPVNITSIEKRNTYIIFLF